MPYIPQADRPALDKTVDILADELSNKLIKINKTAHISVLYEDSLMKVIETLYKLEIGGKLKKLKTTEQSLAETIFEIAKEHDYDCPWLGELNYSITRLIQLVPRKMVEKGKWKDEFRYWIFAQTSGALEKAALKINKQLTLEKHAYILNGIIGALIDIKDEYKRRVNTAYEAVQIRKSGDCYDGPYHTELKDEKDASNNLIGYTEIMKDYRKEKTQDKKVE